MDVIITGSGGFLGRELIRQMSQREEYKVYALSSQIEKATAFAATYPNVTVCNADAVILDQVPIGSDTILLNCAFPRSEDDPQIAQGLEYICATLRAAQRSGVGAIINISSQSVYDIHRKNPAQESDAPVLQSKYAVGKYATELFTRMLQTTTPITNIRLASLIGPQFDQRLTNKMVDFALKNREISALISKQYFGFLDVEDAARGILLLMQTPFSKWKPIYNLGSDFSYTILQIAQAVADLMQKEWDLAVTVKEVSSDATSSSALCNELLKATIGTYQKITLDESLRRIITAKYIARGDSPWNK